jgi:hypothetical protein
MIDQYGLGAESTYKLFNQFVYSNGGRLILESTDSWGTFNGYDVKVLNALQFCSDLYNIYQVVTEDRNIWEVQGNAAMVPTEPWNRNAYVNLRARDTGVMVMPRGPNADQLITSWYLSPMIMALPRINNDVESVFRIICEYMLGIYGPGSSLGDATPREAAELYMTGWGYTNPADYETWGKMFPASGPVGGIYDPFENYGLPIGTAYNQIKSRSTSVSAALAAIAPLCQAKIDEYFR